MRRRLRGPKPAGAVAGRWSDLAQRMGSGLMVAALGLALLIAGGVPLAMGIALLIAGLMWELTRITASQRYSSPASRRSRVMALLSAATYVVMVIGVVPMPALLAVIPVAAGWRGTNKNHRGKFAVFTLAFFLASLSLLEVREHAGLLTTVWIAVTAVQSDILGYFVGKAVGGPKFWPAISPNKTWSGTLAGWAGALVIALVIFLSGYGGWGVLIFGPFLALAGQMGDIAESALKRRTGIKDSSDLIPGHGGVMDRFDALTAAFLVTILSGPLVPVLGG